MGMVLDSFIYSIKITSKMTNRSVQAIYSNFLRVVSFRQERKNMKLVGFFELVNKIHVLLIP